MDSNVRKKSGADGKAKLGKQDPDSDNDLNVYAFPLCPTSNRNTQPAASKSEIPSAKLKRSRISPAPERSIKKRVKAAPAQTESADITAPGPRSLPKPTTAPSEYSAESDLGWEFRVGIPPKSIRTAPITLGQPQTYSTRQQLTNSLGLPRPIGAAHHAVNARAQPNPIMATTPGRHVTASHVQTVMKVQSKLVQIQRDIHAQIEVCDNLHRAMNQENRDAMMDRVHLESENRRLRTQRDKFLADTCRLRTERNGIKGERQEWMRERICLVDEIHGLTTEQDRLERENRAMKARIDQVGAPRDFLAGGPELTE